MTHSRLPGVRDRPDPPRCQERPVHNARATDPRPPPPAHRAAGLPKARSRMTHSGPLKPPMTHSRPRSNCPPRLPPVKRAGAGDFAGALSPDDMNESFTSCGAPRPDRAPPRPGPAQTGPRPDRAPPRPRPALPRGPCPCPAYRRPRTKPASRRVVHRGCPQALRSVDNPTELRGTAQSPRSRARARQAPAPHPARRPKARPATPAASAPAAPAPPSAGRTAPSESR